MHQVKKPHRRILSLYCCHSVPKFILSYIVSYHPERWLLADQLAKISTAINSGK